MMKMMDGGGTVGGAQSHRYRAKERQQHQKRLGVPLRRVYKSLSQVGQNNNGLSRGEPELGE